MKETSGAVAPVMIKWSGSAVTKCVDLPTENSTGRLSSLSLSNCDETKQSQKYLFNIKPPAHILESVTSNPVHLLWGRNSDLSFGVAWISRNFNYLVQRSSFTNQGSYGHEFVSTENQWYNFVECPNAGKGVFQLKYTGNNPVDKRLASTGNPYSGCVTWNGRKDYNSILSNLTFYFVLYLLFHINLTLNLSITFSDAPP
jgi:hypothetical protein